MTGHWECWATEICLGSDKYLHIYTVYIDNVLFHVLCELVFRHVWTRTCFSSRTKRSVTWPLSLEECIFASRLRHQPVCLYAHRLFTVCKHDIRKHKLTHWWFTSSYCSFWHLPWMVTKHIARQNNSSRVVRCDILGLWRAVCEKSVVTFMS